MQPFGLTGIRRLADAYRKVSAGAAEAFVPSYLLDEYGATLQMVQGFSTLPATRKYRDNPQGVVHSKNGSKSNGFHSAASTKGKMENGSHAGLLTCLRAVPQQFLDFALSGAISTLCCNKNVIAPNTGVRNDARVILRQLVRTGRLSARCFMVPEQQLSFTEVLNALKVDPRESTTLSAYTPFELADDILSFCTDASERQMIGIFHFMTSRAAPEDVASFFARKSRKGERRCIISKCTRFLCLNKTPRPTPSESEELSRLTQKIVAFGLVRSTQQIVRYAKCNASLLRDAIDRLLSRDEIRFLANCLLDMLTEPTKFFYLANATERCNVLKYLTVIFDHSVDSFSENEPTEYVRMKKVIAALVAETTNVLSLQTALHESVEFVETTRPNRILVTNVVHDKTAPASLPPYQIERLVF